MIVLSLSFISAFYLLYVNFTDPYIHLVCSFFVGCQPSSYILYSPYCFLTFPI